MEKLPLTAIILARAGSKRLPGKNTLPLAGKPLIQWTLDVARESKIFEKIIVSTDCENVKEILKNQNVIVFNRSRSLAHDSATSVSSMIEVVQHYNISGAIMLLQPTSPLRTIDDCLNAWTMFQSKQCSSIVSATEAKPESRFKTKNHVGVEIALNGAIYVVKAEDLLCHKKLLFHDTNYLMMPEERSVDIDFPEDLAIAESYLSRG